MENVKWVLNEDGNDNDGSQVWYEKQALEEYEPIRIFYRYGENQYTVCFNAKVSDCFVNYKEHIHGTNKKTVKEFFDENCEYDFVVEGFKFLTGFAKENKAKYMPYQRCEDNPYSEAIIPPGYVFNGGDKKRNQELAFDFAERIINVVNVLQNCKAEIESKKNNELDFDEVANFVVGYLPAISEGKFAAFIEDLTAKYTLSEELINVIYDFVKNYLENLSNDSANEVENPATNESENSATPKDNEVEVIAALDFTEPAPVIVSSVEDAVTTLLNAFKNQDFPTKLARTMIAKDSNFNIPCYKWSLGNLALMTLQGTNDARGFNQWKAAGRHVKAGTKAIRILAPCTKKIKEIDSNGQEVESVIIAGFKTTPVFKIEDTEGKKVDTPNYTPKDLPPFYSVAEKIGVNVEYMPYTKDKLGFFSPDKKKIQLNSYDSAVYFHELSHAVHNIIEKDAFKDKARAEIVAEFSSAVLCQMVGIEGQAFNAYEYVKKYCHTKTPNGTIKKIMNLLGTIEKVVTFILDAAKGQ